MSIASSQFAILGVVAFALTGLLTWPIRALAIRLGAMDVPNLARKTQAEPVPYLGGVAIALGISIVTFLSLFYSSNTKLIVERGLVAIIPALLLGVMGLFDDLKAMSPWPRLLMQTSVGTAVALIIMHNGTIGTPFGSPILNTSVTIAWIVGICNSVNFFDNLDGAASGSIAIIALGIFFIAYDQEQELVSALTIVTTGATLGFLMWNKSPAKIYMGDAGALFLGVIVSIATIRLKPGILPTWQSLSIPVMMLAIPILDTCVAVISRVARGKSPLTGGRDHLSHRLTRAGLDRKSSAITLWIASGFSTLSAIGVYLFPGNWAQGIVIIFCIIWMTLLCIFLRIPSQD